MASYSVLKREVDQFNKEAEQFRKGAVAYNKSAEAFNAQAKDYNAGQGVVFIGEYGALLNNGEMVQTPMPAEAVEQYFTGNGTSYVYSNGQWLARPTAPAEFTGVMPELNLSQKDIRTLQNPTVSSAEAERLRAFGANPNTALANQQSRNSAFSSQSQFDGRGVLQRALQGDL